MRATHQPGQIPHRFSHTSPLSTAPSHSPTIRSQPSRAMSHSADAVVPETLTELCQQIRALREGGLPDFAAVLAVCEQLKVDEDCLKQALLSTEASGELDQLRHALPRLFRLIDRCLDVHRDMPRNLAALQTLCMGLAALAPPRPGPLLTGEQCSAARPLLTSISLRLAKALTHPFAHQTADAGLLLNCLNWFSRALKADLLPKQQAAVMNLFQQALQQLHQWSDSPNSDALNSRQLAKAMVQLNTMIRQGLVDTDPATPAGMANRQHWTACVSRLCKQFLSTDQWLKTCHGVALINVTNTLKDGLDAGLLNGHDAALKQAFGLIARRIRQQSFTTTGNLTELSNCANFMRCLFEHDLLDAANAATNSATNAATNTSTNASATDAMLHLIGEVQALGQRTLSTSDAQALVNLASFLKAADRWLAASTVPGSRDAHAALARASAQLLSRIGELGSIESPWMRTPQCSSALLLAVQHLWQRGLLAASPHSALSALVQQLIRLIPQWPAAEGSEQSALQALRALVALVAPGQDASLQAKLHDSDAFPVALKALLHRLQQGRTESMNAEEKFACLQAVHLGVMAGAFGIGDLQVLLQRVLGTRSAVDQVMLAQALLEYGASVTAIEAPIEASTGPAREIPTNGTSTSATPPAKTRGATYRAEVSSPNPASPMTSPRSHLAPLSSLSSLSSFSSTSPRIPRPDGDDDWIAPRHPLRSGQINPAGVASSPPPLMRTASTSPTLTSRKASPPASSSPAPSPSNNRHQASSPVSPRTPPTSPVAITTGTHKPASPGLAAAQREWFALLTDAHPKALPQLQALAARYPELVNQKSAGKKGQTALFHALTQGSKEVVAWLLRHERHVAIADPGSFLLNVLNSIGMLQKRHLAGLRLLIDAMVKEHDRRESERHAQHMPDATPLSKRALQGLRAGLFSDLQKQALGKFTQLTSVLEEYKLIMPASPEEADDSPSSKRAAPQTRPELNSLSSPYVPSFDPLQAFDDSAFLMSPLIIGELASLARKSSMHELSPKISTTEGINALMFMADLGNLAVIKDALCSTPDVDELVMSQSTHGITALMFAARKGHAEIASTLLNAAADKNALAQLRNVHGFTALMVAANQGHTKTVTAILNAVSDKRALALQRDFQGRSALKIALDNGHTYAALAILNLSADPDELMQLSRIQITALLILAAHQGDVEVVRALLKLDHRADTIAGLRGGHDMTALDWAAENNHPEVAKVILSAVSHPTKLLQMHSRMGKTALIRAASKGHADIVTAILEATKFDESLIQIRDDYGMNAFMWAITNDHNSIAQALLEPISDKETFINTIGYEGRTALTWAAISGNTAAVVNLLEAVTDKQALAQLQDDEGMTALAWAKERGHVDTAAAIERLLNDPSSPGNVTQRDTPG